MVGAEHWERGADSGPTVKMATFVLTITPLHLVGEFGTTLGSTKLALMQRRSVREWPGQNMHQLIMDIVFLVYCHFYVPC